MTKPSPLCCVTFLAVDLVINARVTEVALSRNAK